jgi:hypothetical protein
MLQPLELIQKTDKPIAAMPINQSEIAENDE